MSSADVFWSFIKMISALAVILGLMIGALYFFKRFLKNTGTGMDRGELIRVIASRHLGPKSNIMLLDIAGRVVAVGLAGNRMTLLATITEPEALDRLKSLQSGGSAASFTDQLMSYKAKLDTMRLFGDKGNRE